MALFWCEPPVAKVAKVGTTPVSDHVTGGYVKGGREETEAVQAMVALSLFNKAGPEELFQPQAGLIPLITLMVEMAKC
jgi:ketopantoate hydroxymethyltransferase